MKIFLLLIVLFIFSSCVDKNILNVIEFDPVVSILSPENGNIFSYNDTILFLGEITNVDDENLPNLAKWISDKDGVLSVSTLDSTWTTSFSTNALTYDSHIISLVIEDNHGNSITDSVMIYNNFPEAVVLNTLEKDYNSISLSWSLSLIPDFSCYKIYRSENENQGSNGDLICEINDVNITTFNDSSIQIGREYYYQIFVLNVDSIQNGSNVEYIESGIFINTFQNIDKLSYNSERQKIFALDIYDNSLLIIDALSIQIEETLEFGGSITDFDIDQNNDYIYLSMPNDEQIIKLCLDTYEIENSFSTNGYPGPDKPYLVRIISNNSLFLSCGDYGMNNWNDFYIVNIDNGNVISWLEYAASGPTCALSNDHDYLYVVPSSSPCWIEKFNISNDSFVTEDAALHYGYAHDMNLSSDDLYLYTGTRKHDTNDLSNVLLELDDNECIFLSSNDDSKVFSNYNVFDSCTFNFINELPIVSRIMTISQDDSVLYIFEYESQRLYFYVL